MQIQAHNLPNIKEVNSRLVFNVFYNIIYYFLSIVLLVSGLSKLYNPFSLLESMRISLPLPTLVLIGLVAFIAIAETLIGLLLLLRLKLKESLVASTIIYVFVFVYTLLCFFQNVPGETGFFGGFIKCDFDFSMVIKNSVFLLLSISLLVKEIELPD